MPFKLLVRYRDISSSSHTVIPPNQGGFEVSKIRRESNTVKTCDSEKRHKSLTRSGCSSTLQFGFLLPHQPGLQNSRA